MLLETEKTLGEIAAENPAAVRVFEKYQLDFCCHGNRPVEQACREKGLSAEQLLAELESTHVAEQSQDWAAASLAALAGHIVSRHHNYLREELPSLGRTIAKVIEAHGRNHSDSLLPLQHAFQGLAAELTAHMMKEEMILFPLIERLEAAHKEGVAFSGAPGGSIGNPIRMMEHEHDSAAAALAQMRQATSDYTLPPDACNTYRNLFQRLTALESDLHVHIHLENNILFPRACRLEAGPSGRS
ncbi:MAG TPA: iron-sulfur cluster repair di-iron protein [Bryobacterales bacterium]|nr:iron-sulfur cluster repair di-iron protein [Bryobacterales bacterium]